MCMWRSDPAQATIEPRPGPAHTAKHKATEQRRAARRAKQDHTQNWHNYEHIFSRQATRVQCANSVSGTSGRLTLFGKAVHQRASDSRQENSPCRLTLPGGGHP